LERWSEIRNKPLMGKRPIYHDNYHGQSNFTLIAADPYELITRHLSKIITCAHWANDADRSDIKTLMKIG